METVDEVVYVLDHDTPVREAVCTLLRANGKNVRAFGSGTEFLAHRQCASVACLLLDMRMPDMSGLEVQKLVNRKANLSVVFVTAESDIPSTVLAMKSGAIDFLIKPVEERTLMAAVEMALARTRKLLREAAESAALMALYRKLTPRERELLPLLAQGLLNKQAAGLLGITEYTVQVHRSQIMKKMQANSFATLVKQACRLQLEEPDRLTRETGPFHSDERIVRADHV